VVEGSIRIEVGSAAARSRFGWTRITRAFRQERLLRMGGVLIALVVAAALLAPVVAPHNPTQPHPLDALSSPSWAHPLGTDASGFDVLSRLLYAPRVDVTVAVVATLLSILIGAPLGVLAGYLGKGVGESIVRVSDIVQAFPIFILAMALVSLTGHSQVNLILTIAFLNSPLFLRLMRSHTLSVRKRTFVEASTIGANSTRWTIFRHVLPNSISPVFIQGSVTIGWSILLVAGLSFVGAGIRAPTPEWGSMIAIGSDNIVTGEWWPSVFPGLAIMVTVLGFSLFGAGLQRLYARGRL
jgi:peptide/nickel transport system permease protein